MLASAASTASLLLTMFNWSFLFCTAGQLPLAGAAQVTLVLDTITKSPFSTPL